VLGSLPECLEHFAHRLLVQVLQQAQRTTVRQQLHHLPREKDQLLQQVL
jgi:hypothetical protein